MRAQIKTGGVGPKRADLRGNFMLKYEGWAGLASGWADSVCAKALWGKRVAHGGTEGQSNWPQMVGVSMWKGLESAEFNYPRPGIILGSGFSSLPSCTQATTKSVALPISVPLKLPLFFYPGLPSWCPQAFRRFSPFSSSPPLHWGLDFSSVILPEDILQ